MAPFSDDTSRHFANGQFHDFDFRDNGHDHGAQGAAVLRNSRAGNDAAPASTTSSVSAHDIGITTPLNERSDHGDRIERGAACSTMPSGMASSPTAGRGTIRCHPRSQDKDGNVHGQAERAWPKQVITAQEAYLITFILTDYFEPVEPGLEQAFAGKSGTTNNYRDAWMMADRRTCDWRMGGPYPDSGTRT